MQVPKFQYIAGDFGSIFVPTVETTRLTYFLDSLVPNKHHVMFVGNTGAPQPRACPPPAPAFKQIMCLPQLLLAPHDVLSHDLMYISHSLMSQRSPGLDTD